MTFLYLRSWNDADFVAGTTPHQTVVVQPDVVLGAVVGTKPLPRTELTKKLWVYIKKNSLQDKKIRTQIDADEALKAVFGGKKSVSMFEMTKFVSKHVKA